MQTEDVALGHLARPDAGGETAPGVVMIHDVWGLAEHTRDLAGRLAGEGFRVLAVDLYRHLAPVEISDPGAWMRDLDDARVLADLQSAVDFLGPPTAITGFCMGGMYALLAACTLRDVVAAAPFYGMLRYAGPLLEGKPGRAPLDVAADLRCPLLAQFGDEDAFIPNDDVAALEAALPAEPASEIVVHPGAGHAFLNDTRPEMYRPAAAADAWQRLVAFLRARLAG